MKALGALYIFLPGSLVSSDPAAERHVVVSGAAVEFDNYSQMPKVRRQ